jgi:diguanylate cyclase (GGDEF)-like protein
LRRTLWRLRGAARQLFGALVIVTGAALVATGWFPDLRRGDPIGIGQVAVVILIGVALLYRLAARLRVPARAPEEVRWRIANAAALDRRDAQRDFELGASMIVGLYVVFALTGGARSPVYPLAYALTAFLLTFHRAAVGLPLFVVVLGVETLLYRGGHRDARTLELFCEHSAFLCFFALTHFLFLQGEVLRQKRAHQARLRAEVEAMQKEARDFRLISSQLAAEPGTRDRAADEERLVLGAVESIHLSLFYTLELLKRSLDLHACVLLWLEPGDERLCIKEIVSDSDTVAEGPFAADAGAPGTVIKTGAPLVLRDPKRGHLPYYAGPEEITAFLGVPVLEDGHIRGVLCADRRSGQKPFGEAEEALLVGAAQQMARALESERVFAAVERAKYEHERFFAALAKLNRALGVEAVCATTFEAAREILDFDFAAITVVDPHTGKHTVLAAVGDVPRGLPGAPVEKAGLASMVVKNKHFLPAAGELRDKEQPVFGKKVRLSGIESLLVLPLICADVAIGSFTVAAKRARAFGKDKRDMLGVIANHVAVSLANAQMYGRMEAMATTDGLTGLINHRTFQERFDDMLARADRGGVRHALILTDIDHFKKVNDTYGHPTGDEVLRGVAQVVRDCVRKVDLAARYGGEEFAIVLEGTDLRGARETAERIRAEVQKVVFQSAKGPFSCTLSLGVAVYGGPGEGDGREKKALIAHADQALYHAKHNGRNRAVAFSEMGTKLKAVQ